MLDLSKHLIEGTSNIKKAFEKLNKIPNTLTLFVIDIQGKTIGTITDGDIRRGFLKGLALSDSVEKFMSFPFHYLNDIEALPGQIKEIKDKGVKLLPVLDKEGKIIRVIDFSKVKTILPVDAVLMAGGRGERLRPLTDKTPKPLLKVGEKPIIEHNIDHLRVYGIRNFHFTVRYLGSLIEKSYGNGKDKGIIIKYIYETEPLGTIGSVSLIKDFKHDHVLLMNADLFTNIDLEDFYQDYIDQDADMAIATIPYTVNVPYAVLHLKDEQVQGFREKPTYTYHSNAGIYLIKRKLLDIIPTNISFNATDFIQMLIDSGKKVIRFPIIGYWIDIGNPDDYNKVQEIAKHIPK